MCGITGMASFTKHFRPDRIKITKMVKTLIHRGPDAEGIELADNVALGMRRLSIIDIETGGQPIFNEDRTIALVFNGEIYNYLELRRTLQSLGHKFYTQSDTETIIHAYEQFGMDFPKRLNGMFAIALHDKKNNKLILVRDHLGIKPLYYCFTDKYLIWGSEIKAILASGIVDKELDFDAVKQFLAWEYVPGTSTLFKNIKKLAPATILMVDLNNPVCTPCSYWDINMNASDQVRSDQEWFNLLDEQIKCSVKRQMISDVPLGAFLSGGVDSSLIVAGMQDAKTFSIGFSDQSYNELPWASMVADHLGVEHIQEIISPHVVDQFDHLLYFMDDPIGDFSIFPTFLVSRLARSHVKVVLSGDGGDELFGGYETYIAHSLAKRYAKIPSSIIKYLFLPLANSLKPREMKKGLINKSKRFLEGLTLPQNLAHARWRLFASEEHIRSIFTEEVSAEFNSHTYQHILDLFAHSKHLGALNSQLYVDVKSYLADNILTKVDRMSMAVSLESRVPLLDVDLVDLAFQIPEQLKVRHHNTKVLLKRIAAKYVPEKAVYRPKEGFSIPIKNWLNSQFKPLMDTYIGQENIENQGIFRYQSLQQLKQEHRAGIKNHSHLLWSMIMFQAWYEKWYKN